MLMASIIFVTLVPMADTRAMDSRMLGIAQEDVHDTHDDIVYPAAAVTGDGPQQTAHHCGNGDGGKGHRQGDPGAVDDPGPGCRGPPRRCPASALTEGGWSFRDAFC